ncbi:hypothetical protein V6N11_056686 [Hibiscus sabdariffa]|uniref:Uncharacterized protein n=1 Tax=Hibiscus sabdariffa TaxID=183260 RepID=A0ABR2T577_9ROSI
MKDTSGGHQSEEYWGSCSGTDRGICLHFSSDPHRYLVFPGRITALALLTIVTPPAPTLSTSKFCAFQALPLLFRVGMRNRSNPHCSVTLAYVAALAIVIKDITISP